MLKMMVKEGDYVTIGDDIKVFVIESPGGRQTMFGIEAPDDAIVFRSKLYEENISRLAARGNLEARRKLSELKPLIETRERKQVNNEARRKWYEETVRKSEEAF